MILQTNLKTSHKIIKEKDDLISNSNKNFEDILKEYRNKIKILISTNKNVLDKLKELNTSYEVLKNKYDLILIEVNNRDNRIQTLNCLNESQRIEMKLFQDNSIFN